MNATKTDSHDLQSQLSWHDERGREEAAAYRRYQGAPQLIFSAPVFALAREGYLSQLRSFREYVRLELGIIGDQVASYPVRGASTRHHSSLSFPVPSQYHPIGNLAKQTASCIFLGGGISRNGIASHVYFFIYIRNLLDISRATCIRHQTSRVKILRRIIQSVSHGGWMVLDYSVHSLDVKELGGGIGPLSIVHT